MSRNSTLPLYDTILGGRLKPMLRAWRDEDPPVTFDDIAERLRAEGVRANRETVRRWVKTIQLEDAEPDQAVS